jgi:drug/metabolite transporter (DMT)-like permease
MATASACILALDSNFAPADVRIDIITKRFDTYIWIWIVQGGIRMPGEVTALFAAICYSLSYVLLHKGQSEAETRDNGLLPILTISGVTLGLALAAKLVLYRQSFRFAPGWSTSVAFCAAAGVFSTFIGRMALYAAIARLGATRGVVIKSLAPMVTIVLAVTFLGENPQEDEVVGAMLLLASICLLIMERMWMDERSFIRSAANYGILLGLGAALFQGSGHVLRKLGMNPPIDPILAATLDIFFALLAYAVWNLAAGELHGHVIHYIRSRNKYIWAAGFLSGAAVLLFFTAIASTPLTTVTVIVGMEPVFVTVISLLFFRGLERFTWVTFVYTLIVVIGAATLVVGT